MQNRPVENILRERLRQHPTPLDTDALWAEVEPRLPRERSLLAFWPWLVAGLLLLSGGFYLFFLQPIQNESQAASSPSPVAVDIPSTTAPAPRLSRGLPYTAPARRRPKADTETVSAQTPLPAVVQGAKPRASTPLATRRPLSPATQQTSPPARTNKDFQEKTLRVAAVKDNQAGPAKLEPTKPAPADITVPSARLNTQHTSPLVAKIAAAKPTTSPAPLATDLPVSESTNPTPFRQTAAPALARRTGYTQVASLAPQPSFNQPRLRLSPADAPGNIRKKQSPYWTLEPGIALSLPSRSVTAAGESPNEEQALINDEYERALEAVSIQGLVGYHRPSGLSFRTGIAYSRLNSKVASEFTAVGTETVETVVAIIESPNGRRSEQTGTVEVATETTTAEQYYNSVSTIDLPLLLGYRFSGTKWGLSVEAGPTLNLRSSGRAHLYNGAGGYRLVDDGHFRSRISGPGFLANIGGSYRLSEKAMLTANLRLQGFGSGGFESPSAGYATKYTLLGVQVGYRVRL